MISILMWMWNSMTCIGDAVRVRVEVRHIQEMGVRDDATK
jgi:hypothetical protein